MSIQSERLEKQVIAIAAADPTLRRRDIAQLLDCSTKTIDRALQKNASTLEEIDDKLREVRNRLKERLPIEKRVEILASMAESKETLGFARLGAVKYINELDDIVPELDRKKALKDEPAGDVTINVVYQHAAPGRQENTRIIDVDVKDREPESGE